MELIIGNILGLILGIGLALVYQRVTGMASRLERKLDLVIKHAGIDVDKVAIDEAATLMRAGKKIEAIRIYREFTGCSLAEAKAKVESAS